MEKIFLAIVGYHFEKVMRLLRRSRNRSIFWLLHKSGNADEPDRTPSIKTNGSRKEQRLEGTAGGVRSPISAFQRFHVCLDRSCDMLTSIFILKDNFIVSLLVLWPFLLQCSAQTHQRRSMPISCDGFTRFQQLIIHHTELVPPNVENNLSTVNIRSGCRRGDMSRHSLWFSALEINCGGPIFCHQFGTSLQQVMPPIRNLRIFDLFHSHAGPRH